MPNNGLAPPDPNTEVGSFRYTYGDILYTDLDPAQPGFGDYEELSDADIEALLAQGGSVPGAIGYLYLAMSGHAAKESRSVKDQDLAIDLTKRAADLRAVAQMWFDRVGADDLIAAEEAFEIVPTGRSCGGVIPEGSPPVWGRVYGIGRAC